jgi:hypothetical protein
MERRALALANIQPYWRRIVGGAGH